MAERIFSCHLLMTSFCNLRRVQCWQTWQALVLVPTRELAVQVNAVLGKLATSRRLSTALLVGGRPYGSQISALRYGSQIVVGTPGRVKDHLERGSLVLSQLRVCVLDEADQMLDIGFAPVIEEILATTPDTRQTALFSATMPDWIATLQKKFLKNPVNVDITAARDVQNTIEQIAYQVPQEQKMAALCTLLHSTEGESSLIFGKTKFGVEKLGKQLSRLGFTVGTLHGNKSQRAREEVLTAFRRGQVQTLLATNVAARGLDITGIYQVINYELPESSELFTHRIGRTGRMGRQGKAITLLVPSDVPKWRRMARNLGQAVALQRLAIDEETSVSIPSARPEALVTQEHEQNGEQRPVRGREHFSPDQEHNRLARPKHDSHPASHMKRRQKESGTSGTSVLTPARQLERPYSNKERDGRRGAGKQSSFGRTTGKHKAHSFAAAEPQHPIARRMPRATPAARTRRPTASNRFASR
ncbi:MAG: DEAD/DEAH box helicase [Chloroflexi bacterium]|nr:MAG: DEAD/DEAH box helicase [Chloroflexota bacterium]